MTVMQAWSRKSVSAGVVFFAAIVGVTAYAQNPARDRDGIGTSTSYEDYLKGSAARVSELVGKRVRDARGDAVGEVDEVVLGKSNDLALIVSVGGLLDIGDKLIARPLDDFRIAADGSELYLDITDQQLAAEPSYSYVHDADEQTPSAAGPSAHAGDLGERVAGLLGANVVDESGREIGKIDDLVVSLEDDEEARAVLSVGGIVGIGAKLVAVPLADIDVDAKDPHRTAQVRVNMHADAVESMPRFEYSQREERTAAL